MCYRLGVPHATNCSSSRFRLFEIRSARLILVLVLTVASPGLLSTEGEDGVEKSPAERAAESASSGPETAKVATEDAPTVDPGRTEIELTYAFGHAGRVELGMAVVANFSVTF